MEEFEKIAKNTIMRMAPGFKHDQNLLIKVIDDIVDGDMRFDENKKTSRRSWRITSARWAVRNYLKKEKKATHSWELISESYYEDHTSNHIFSEDVYAYMVKILGEVNTSIIYAYYVEGLTMEEIAKDMNVSKQAIDQRIKRHSQKLKTDRFREILCGLS